MAEDEEGTHARLIALREASARISAANGGRLVGVAGDAILVDFPSVVDALKAAVAMQEAATGAGSDERRLELRIGINLGDVIVDGDDIFGEGVNVAQRVQTLAEPGGIAVSGPVYDQVRNKLKLGFRDLGSHTVKNIAEPVRVYAVERGGAPGLRRGLRRPAMLALIALPIALLAALLALWLSGQAPDLPLIASGGGGAAPIQSGEPTVAVLPFSDRSEGPRESWFSDGVTEDIISELGRFSGLRVLSWSAVAPYRDAEITPAELSRELGVRYVVSGSLARQGERLRISVQLTDAEEGILLWSERYDSPIDDVFAMQDQIARTVVGALAVRVTRLEEARAFAKPTDNLDAYDYVLRGRELIRELRRETNFEARAMFERAAALDPDYGDAYEGLAWTHLNDLLYGWTEWPHRAAENARELAARALALDERNAGAHALLAFLAQLVPGEEAEAWDNIERAIAINPNDPMSLAIKGYLLVGAGEFAEAAELLELALRLDPNPGAFWLFALGEAYYFLGRYQDAVDLLTRFTRHFGEDPALHAVLAASQAQLGRSEAAADTVESLKRTSPFFDADSFARQLAPEGQEDHLREGLRKAGLLGAGAGAE